MNLFTDHSRQLTESGIQYREWLGLESGKNGLRFTYFDPEEEKFTKFVRTRLDDVKDGRKYHQEKGSGVKLYFPPTFAASPDEQKRDAWYRALRDGDDEPRPVVVVEGEKKALALQQALGYRWVVIGLGGVWNWGQKADDGDRTFINDWKLVKSWKDREVFICFDSDVYDNPQVEHAEYMLQRQMRKQLGVKARLVSLHPGDNGEKVAIDDLVREYGEGFKQLWDRELSRDAIRGTRHRLPKAISGRELCDTDWEFQDVILSDGESVHLLVEGGTSFIHAGSGVGKTYFLLQLSACLASGTEFLGFQPRKGNVLFLQQELSNGWFARRVRRLRDAFGAAVDSIEFVSGDFNLASVDRYKVSKLHLERLERLIHRSGAQLVVLDPLQGFYDLSENSTDHSREFMKAVVRVAKNTGVHILMSHHDRKDQTGSSMSQMRGGSPFSDLADTVIGIKRMPRFTRSDSGKRVYEKDEFGEVVYHPTDLILNFDKVRHSEGPLPNRTELTRMESFDDGSRNPFFVLKEDSQGVIPFEGGDDNEEDYSGPAPF